MDAPPIRQAPPPPVPSGMGCFAKGCLTLVVVVVVFGIVLIGGGLFVVNRGINLFTATTPAQIQTRPATPTELQLAKAKLDSLRSAIRNRVETTIEFTADDINALLQNEPEFRDAHNHARVAIANSIVSLDVSAPLDSAKWSRLKGRWFNGNIQFGFSYVDDNFNFDVRSAEANGYQFPRALLTAEFVQSFNRSLNDSFRRESARGDAASDLWRHIRMATVQNDKLIVTTRAL
ncbi:MAG TPA: hypothetical protein VJR93_02160 [Chthoniobacterales bacterium]|nr:hypothetical protein [Chthoniobacterales bacterium]